MTAETHQAALSEAATARVRATDLMVVVRRERQGPELAQERVLDSDVTDIFTELWRDGWLRAWKPDVPYDALSFQITAQVVAGLPTEPPSRRGQETRAEQWAGSKCEKLVFQASDSEGRTRSM